MATDAQEQRQDQQRDQHAKELHSTLDDLVVQANVGNYEGVKALAERLRTSVSQAGFQQPSGAKAAQSEQQTSQGPQASKR
jgi:hypothetical protein